MSDTKWIPKTRDFVWFYNGHLKAEAVIIGRINDEDIYKIELNDGQVKDAHVKQIEQREPELKKKAEELSEFLFIPRFVPSEMMKTGLSFPRKTLIEAIKLTSREFAIKDVLEVRVVKVHPVLPV